MTRASTSRASMRRVSQVIQDSQGSTETISALLYFVLTMAVLVAGAGNAAFRLTRPSLPSRSLSSPFVHSSRRLFGGEDSRGHPSPKDILKDFSVDLETRTRTSIHTSNNANHANPTSANRRPEEGYVDRKVISNSLYVPGGGFSGFFHRLGQLQSIPRDQLMDQTYVCYSAGCLATVATLRGWTNEQILNQAQAMQQLWYDGSAALTDMLPMFIDGLLADIDEEEPPEWMSKLAILTSSTSREDSGNTDSSDSTSRWSNVLPSWNVKPFLTRPTTVSELRQRLIQTAWIPYITGKTLWKDGHMDGGVSIMHHPICSKRVRSGDDWSLFRYMLDPTFDEKEAYRIIAAGKAFGV